MKDLDKIVMAVLMALACPFLLPLVCSDEKQKEQEGEV